MTNEELMELALALGLWLESVLAPPPAPARERACEEEPTP
jgi:hypothetical protein